MATADIIGRGIIALHEAFPSRDVGERTVELWSRLFRNVSDEEFTRGVEALLLEPDRKFFPAPGEVLRACRGPLPPIDVEAIRRQIAWLGTGSVHVGHIWPRVERVREVLGNGVAEAYGAIGGTRLGANEGTTLEIALRDFGAELQAIAHRDGPKALLPPEPGTLLANPDASPVNKAVKGLTKRLPYDPDKRGT